MKETERERHIAEIEEMKSEEVRRATEMQKQQTNDNVKELVKLKAANKKLIEDNGKLLSWSILYVLIISHMLQLPTSS